MLFYIVELCNILSYVSRYNPETTVLKKSKRMPSCRRQTTPEEVDSIGKIDKITRSLYVCLLVKQCYVGFKARSSGSLGLLGLFKISQFANHNTGSLGLSLQHW